MHRIRLILGWIVCGASLGAALVGAEAKPSPSPTPPRAIPVSTSSTNRTTTTVSPGTTTQMVRYESTSSRSSTRPSTTVVIDAGHGGFDRGGIPGQRVPEKVMNLDVAQRLKAILQANGYRVVMTRDSDVFVPLPTRVAIANSYRDAIFVCVHFNSATRSGASGIETYFYSRESLPLASAIHYYVAGGAPTSNRGVRRRGYYVLRRTNIPSVLVECGFLTNPTEAQYAQSGNYRQQLAEEIARGIRNRGAVATSSSTARLAGIAPVVPLQPFIDQTRVRDPDLSHKKRSSKKSSKSSRARKKSSSSSKKSSDSGDSETPKTRKKSTKQSED